MPQLTKRFLSAMVRRRCEPLAMCRTTLQKIGRARQAVCRMRATAAASRFQFSVSESSCLWPSFVRR